MSTLARQGTSTSKPYSLARDNQFRDQIEGAFNALSGCGVASGGAVTPTTGFSGEVAAGTVIFAEGVTYTLASAQAFTVSYPSTTRYLWGKLQRTAANQNDPTALDTYALDISSTGTNTAPSSTHFPLGTVVTDGSGIVSISDPAEKYVGTLGQAEFVLRDGSRSFTGDVDFGGNLATNLADPVADDDGATKGYVDTAIEAAVAEGADLTAYVKIDGTRPFTANQSMGGNKLTALATPTNSTDAAPKGYVDTACAAAAAAIDLTPYTKKDGTRAFTGDQSMGGNKLTNVGAPASGGDAANKTYVDNAVSGFVTTDRYVRVSSADTTPSDLDTKTDVGRGLAKSIAPGSGDQVLTYELDAQRITLPEFEVTCPPGEERIIEVVFGGAAPNEIGTFPDADAYTVAARFDNSTLGTTGGGCKERAEIVEIAGFNGVLNSSDPASTFKNGTRCYLKLKNHSPDDWDGGTSSQVNTFQISVLLSGCGWVAGANPSADAVVTVYEFSSWHTETFTLSAITVPKGGSAVAEVDFSGLGTYQGAYSIVAEPANTDSRCWVLASGRTGDVFQLLVENDTGAASTNVTLTVTLEGRRWWAVDDTLNPNTPASPSISVVSSTSPTARKTKEFALSATVTAGTFDALHVSITETTYIGGTASTASQGRCSLANNDFDTVVTYTKKAPGGGSTTIGTATFTAGTQTATFSFPSGEITLSAGDWLEGVASGDVDAEGWLAVSLVGEVAA